MKSKNINGTQEYNGSDVSNIRSLDSFGVEEMGRNDFHSLHKGAARWSESSQAGFTLIELVIVVIVLGILGSIAIPQFIDITDRAKASSYATNVQSAVTSANVKATRDGGDLRVSTPGTPNCNFDGYRVWVGDARVELVEEANVSTSKFGFEERLLATLPNNGDNFETPNNTVAQFEIPRQRNSSSAARGASRCYIVEN